MSMNRRDVANQSVRARMETESKEAWEMEAERDRSQKLGRNPAATLFPAAAVSLGAPSWSMALQRFTQSCFAEVAFVCSRLMAIHTMPTPIPLVFDIRVAAILRFLTAHYAHTGSVATSSVGEEETRMFSVLDIGCNSGKLTIQLAQTLLALLRKVSGDGTGVEIIGVDIDPKLIGQAKEAAGIARSLHRPPKLSSEEGVAGGEQLPTETVFFPSCFPALFGPLKSAANDDERGAKGRRASTAHLEPRLLRLIAAEWVHPSPATSSSFHYSLHPLSHLTNLDKRQYSTILVLSITKWIHIQRSDSGLTLFFARLSSTLLPGGLLFLKRQEWKSYSTPRTSTLG
ncbi:hypothetical protein NDA11_001610 [Ustilago hordei]|nr:hypothetical protein NDA10_000459 [Ustilago hordei]KAJ1594191.1 hypothetical protein NDA11_001610 [Ustilago hordei]